MLENLLEICKKREKKINKIEKIKNKTDFDQAYARLIEASKKGYEYISEEDKKVFLKYFGLFDKNDFAPQSFMLRIRIPGGKLTPKQAKVIAQIAKDFAKDYIDITTRMQLELRYIKIENIIEIFKRLKDVNLTSFQTGIDNIRNIVTDPLDAIAYDNYIEVFPTILKMQKIFLEKREWIGTLPRKFNTAISGSISNRCNLFGHDCSFALANKDGDFGFNVYLGGKVGKISKNVNIFLTKDEIVPFYENLLRFYKEFGFRDNRNKNRLYFLLEAIGFDNFKKIFEKYTDKEYKSAGDTLCKMDHFDAKEGKVLLKDGSYALHAVIPGGIFSGSDLEEAANMAKDCNGEIRLTIEQNLYITSLKNPKDMLNKPFFKKYKNIDSIYFNNLIACAGKKECSFGVIANKPDAIEMANFLTKEVDIKDSKVKIHWSGCVKGCGIHEWADIGFLGTKALIDENIEYGVDIFMGGSFIRQKAAKRVLKSIPLKNAKFLIKEIFLEFKKNKKDKESFEEFYERYFEGFSTGALSFFIIFNALLKKENIDFRFSLSNHKFLGKMEAFEIFDFGIDIYKNLTGEKPYIQIYDFEPLGAKKPPHPCKLNKNLSKTTGDIVYKMIHPNKKERYKVFSEILKEIGYSWI